MKSLKYIAAGLAVIAAAACQKEQAPVQSQERTITFNASFEQPENAETKVVLGDKIEGTTEYPVLWTPDDAFTVFDDTKKSKEFKNSLTDNSVCAIFTGTGTYTDGEQYIAIYPYNGSHSIDGNGIITYKGNGTQTQKSDSNGFPLDKNKKALTSAIAKTTIDKNGASIAFQNLFALVKFKVTDSNITKVQLKNQNEAVYISIKEGNLTISNDLTISTAADRHYIDLTPEGSYFTTDKYYYIAVLPCDDFKPEFKLYYMESESEQNKYKKGSKSIEIKAGDIINLGSFTLADIE